MRYIRLLIEYDGTRYLGWQSQTSGGTIQDILVETIRGITGENVRLTGASRTDAGVHALMQVVGFRTESHLACDALQRALGRKAILDLQPMQPGDVRSTYADTRLLERAVGFSPATPLEEGLARFAEWFKRYYGYA